MSHHALLTPVPLEHLVDGERVCQRAGIVAFGSNAWELFESDDFPLDEDDEVLIYASHSGELAVPRVTWRAQWVRYVRSTHGQHPRGIKVRPPSCRAEDRDPATSWAGFYEVTRLRRLDPADAIPVISLSDRAGARYPQGFFPEGPIVVTRP